MDLADFLGRAVRDSSYRDLEARLGVSRGSLENIVRRQNKNLPTLETLQRISEGFDVPLWSVIQMAGVNLPLPASHDERIERIALLAANHPALFGVTAHLTAIAESRPDYVDGMLIGLEESLRNEQR